MGRGKIGSGARAAMALACVLALAGCSGAPAAEEPIRSSTIVLEAEGGFTQYRVENFDREYYQLGELDSMIRQEVQDYAAGGQAVSVEQVGAVEGGGGQVMVALHFADSHVFEDYMAQVNREQVRLFYGTVKEALGEGYDLAGVLQDAKRGAAITQEQLAKIGDRHVLIFEDAIQVRYPAKVLYISGNLRVAEAGYVDGTEGEGLKYVVIE